MSQSDRNERRAVVDVAGVDLAFRRIQVPDPTPTARQVLASMGVTSYAEHVVLQWMESGDLEEVGLEDPVNVSGIGAPRLVVHRAD